ncbi:MAG: hypothetical protein Q8928_17435 [Bacteroidota bacterium]|nr:hypothetical protein [Bacteroidota bacterium]
MKKLKYIVPIIIVIFVSTNAKSQDVASKLKEAQSAYSSGSLDNARFALQQALEEINKAIGKEILGILPVKMGDMPYVEKEDNVTGAAMGNSSLYVNRKYGTDDKNVKVEIISDSPLLAGINAMLAMPSFLGTGNANQKRIKIAGYKALMQKNSDDNGKTSYDIQVPFNQSLLTVRCQGISSENDAISMANSIAIDKIVKLAQ